MSTTTKKLESKEESSKSSLSYFPLSFSWIGKDDNVPFDVCYCSSSSRYGRCMYGCMCVCLRGLDDRYGDEVKCACVVRCIIVHEEPRDAR